MRRPLFVVCLCLVVIMGLSAKEADWSVLDNKDCIVTGRVYQKDTEYFYLNSIHSIYSEHDAANPQQTISFTDNLICEKDGEAEVLLGSTVRVLGTFDAFTRATNPGEFDREEYYHSIGIGGKLKNVTILEQSGEYSGWRELLYEIREYFKERLYHIFPEKEASVMCAMLLGDKKELDADIKRLYQENGIVHILSISGLHITIIGVSIYGMLRKAGMPIWLAAACGGIILLLYGVMTGMSVSACRAIGMYLLRMLSEVVGRTYDMLTALGLMAFVVVWSNPGYLHNAGFYLSFGAVLGIGALSPAILWEKQEEKVLKYEGRHWKQMADRVIKKTREGLKQSMLSGLSVSLMTLPVQLWFYYEIPTYSVLINLFVIPFMSLVMICGLLAMLVPGLGILGTVDCLILGGYEMLCCCFEQLPFHRWSPGKPEWWQVVVYYLLLAAVLMVRGVWESRSCSENERDCGKERMSCGRSERDCGKEGMSCERSERDCGKERMGCGRSGAHRRMNSRACGKEGRDSGKNSGEGGENGADRRMRENACGKENNENRSWGRWISADVRRVFGVQILLLTVAVIVLGLRINKKTTVTFLDVGQGDCICVQLESGEVYLFDCGSSSRSRVGEYMLKPFLKYYGIDYIDAVFVSHPDEDHCNGVLELLLYGDEWGVAVEQLVLPALEEELRSEKLGELTKAVTQKDAVCVKENAPGNENEELGMQGSVSGTKVVSVKAGDSWSVGENQFLCLHPPKDCTLQESNAYSQCFYISLSEGVSLLLTGDVEEEGEEFLLEELQKRNIQGVTILKVAHHGSKYSTGEAFLKQVQPRVAVISCGADNLYGHPHEDTLERLWESETAVLSTPEYGAITVELGQKPVVRGWINPTD